MLDFLISECGIQPGVGLDDLEPARVHLAELADVVDAPADDEAVAGLGVVVGHDGRGVVAGIDPGLEGLDVLPGETRALEPPEKLLRLAAEHAARDHLDGPPPTTVPRFAAHRRRPLLCPRGLVAPRPLRGLGASLRGACAEMECR